MAPTKNSSPNNSEAARLLAKGFRFLRFDEPLESEFRAEHRTRLRVWNRVAILVSACTVLGFAVLDHFVLSTEHSRISNMVRFGMHIPAVILMLIFTSKRFYVRWYGLGIGFVAPIFGIGTVIMAAFSPPNEAPLVGARLLLAAFFFYFMIGLRFREAARANLIVSRRWSARSSRSTSRPPRPFTWWPCCLPPTSSASLAHTRWSTRIAPHSSSIASSPKSPRTTGSPRF